VANFFAATNRVELILSGGVIYPRLGVLVGPLAVEAFSKIHADVAVMSAGGITLDGVSNSHGLLIEIQLAMIRAAQRVIFCFDSTKLGRRSVSTLCGLDRIHVDCDRRWRAGGIGWATARPRIGSGDRALRLADIFRLNVVGGPRNQLGFVFRDDLRPVRLKTAVTRAVFRIA
jgi:hypothetical protein